MAKIVTQWVTIIWCKTKIYVAPFPAREVCLFSCPVAAAHNCYTWLHQSQSYKVNDIQSKQPRRKARLIIAAINRQLSRFSMKVFTQLRNTWVVRNAGNFRITFPFVNARVPFPLTVYSLHLGARSIDYWNKIFCMWFLCVFCLSFLFNFELITKSQDNRHKCFITILKLYNCIIII